MLGRSMSWLLAAAALSWAAGAAAAEVKVAPYGVTKAGKPVKAYTLINDKGASATILDYGGTIAAINVPDRSGKLENVVMAFNDLAAWEAAGHVNALTGRFANTIQKGFTLDGVYYPLTQAANGGTMHGGIDQYSRRVLAALPIRRQDGASVTLTLDSPDGDQGFPGHLKVAIKYTFTNNNELRTDYTATVTEKATVLNLTNHVYFNLSGNSTVPIFDHIYQVMTDERAGTQPGQARESVIGTPFDFTKPTRLGDHLVDSLGPAYADPEKSPPVPPMMTRGFNAPYYLHEGDNRLDRVAARLSDPATGRILEVRTTEISPHSFIAAGDRPGQLTDKGKPFTRSPSIAIETQHLPNSPNRPELPTTVLRPGQTFKSTTIFAFSTDKR